MSNSVNWSIWDDTGRVIDNFTEHEARAWLKQEKDSPKFNEYYAEDEDGNTIETWNGPILQENKMNFESKLQLENLDTVECSINQDNGYIELSIFNNSVKASTFITGSWKEFNKITELINYVMSLLDVPKPKFKSESGLQVDKMDNKERRTYIKELLTRSSQFAQRSLNHYYENDLGLDKSNTCAIISQAYSQLALAEMRFWDGGIT